MLSVMTLFVAALLASSASTSRVAVERGPALPPPSFCAELDVPPMLAIADEEDELMPFDDEGMSCSESEVLQPYDIEAPVDTI